MYQTAKESRDGFLVNKTAFKIPRDAHALDSKVKRSVTICNLFLNYKLSVSDIVRLLDEEYGRVVFVLMENGIIQERRMLPRAVPAVAPLKRPTLFKNR